MTAPTSARLGAQIWLERDDSAERVDLLVGRAASIGLGQLRAFLMWPWIQPVDPDTWDFRLFDALFEAAERHEMKIKATLTANSGPWWLGTPSVLHSHTLVLDESWWTAAEAYIRACVGRYRDSRALGQWILWNEPSNPLEQDEAGSHRPAQSRSVWQQWLRRNHSDIESLNRRWRTGYTSFEEVPLAEDVAHPFHRRSPWRSFGPDLDDAAFRAEQLTDQIARTAATVRALDPDTPLSVNPSEVLSNHAQAGLNLRAIGRCVDTLGASFHAPWHFTFARPQDHPALVLAGLSLLQNSAPSRSVEVTEFQLGDTNFAGRVSLGVHPDTVAQGYLAPLMAGASSATGWSLNTRAQDFEAGEWGLLDDGDDAGLRAAAVRHVASALDDLERAIGRWLPAEPQCFVLTSDKAQAVDLLFAARSATPAGADAAAHVQGAALLCVELSRRGIPFALAPLDLWEPGPACVVAIAAGLSAWTPAQVERLLEFAAGGGTLLLDGPVGRFTPDAEMLRPWPGGLSRTGLRSAGLLASISGDTTEGVLYHGAPFGRAAGVRSDPRFGSAWRADPAVTFSSDPTPIVWTRDWGRGRIIYTTAALARSLATTPDARPLVHHTLDQATVGIDRRATPTSPDTSALTVHGERGGAILLLAWPGASAAGNELSAVVPPGSYRDIWADRPVEVGESGLFRGASGDHIAILTLLERQEVAPEG